MFSTFLTYYVFSMKNINVSHISVSQFIHTENHDKTLVRKMFHSATMFPCPRFNFFKIYGVGSSVEKQDG